MLLWRWLQIIVIDVGLTKVNFPFCLTHKRAIRVCLQRVYWMHINLLISLHRTHTIHIFYYTQHSHLSRPTVNKKTVWLYKTDSKIPNEKNFRCWIRWSIVFVAFGPSFNFRSYEIKKDKIAAIYSYFNSNRIEIELNWI